MENLKKNFAGTWIYIPIDKECYNARKRAIIVNLVNDVLELSGQ